ncbi:hypothetical protein [Azotobacter chroococcum]|uniref:hypothetical protein n=1 Tax=Azotobacter chroococcum TaxID=353 RepID=UPI0005855883|nr:hypothetical protein [Azotobacter chroococcum]
MNASFPSKTDLRYWIRRLWKNGTWIVLSITIFLVLIPAWYAGTTKLPPLEQLQRREGILTYKHIDNRSGALVGIINDSGTEYFTCRPSQLGKRHDCLRFELLKSLSGKPAEVLWFEQKVNLGSIQKQLARLMVEGEEKISLEKTARKFDFEEKVSIWFSVGFLFFVVLVIRAFDKNIRSKEEDEQHNG